MKGRTKTKAVVYYKNRILSFIINHPGEYGAEEIAKIFSLSRRRVQDYVSEYNKMGFDIESRKCKYSVYRIPRYLKTINEFLINDLKKYAVYSHIKRLCGKTGYYNRKLFVESYSNRGSFSGISEIYMQKIIKSLEEDEGLIYTKDNYLHIYKNPVDNMNDIQLLKFLLFIKIMKFIYPRFDTLNEVYLKLVLKYIERGNNYNFDAAIYPYKTKVSIYDEAVLTRVEDLLYKSLAASISYKSRNGILIKEIRPSGIIYNFRKDMWYIVSSDEYYDSIYRFDKIIDIKPKDECETEFNYTLYKTSFGISTEKEVEVEVLFDREDFIYNKLLIYKKLRENAKVVKVEDGYLLYDKVCGIREFKKWVMAFGNSAKCIKPNRLRYEMLEELNLMQQRYGVI